MLRGQHRHIRAPRHSPKKPPAQTHTRGPPPGSEAFQAPRPPRRPCPPPPRHRRRRQALVLPVRLVFDAATRIRIDSGAAAAAEQASRELLLLVLRNAGFKIRTDDPASLVRVLLRVLVCVRV